MVAWHHLLLDMSLGELWELVMYREAWCAVVHGVAKSQTRLSDCTELIPSYTWPQSLSLLLINRAFFYWSIVALQCNVSICSTTK